MKHHDHETARQLGSHCHDPPLLDVLYVGGVGGLEGWLVGLKAAVSGSPKKPRSVGTPLVAGMATVGLFLYSSPFSLSRSHWDDLRER